MWNTIFWVVVCRLTLLRSVFEFLRLHSIILWKIEFLQNLFPKEQLLGNED